MCYLKQAMNKFILMIKVLFCALEIIKNFTIFIAYLFKVLSFNGNDV